MKTQDWLRLPIEVRLDLVKKHNLKRSSYSDVRGGIVYSDGFTDQDLEKVEILETNETLHERKTTEQNEGTDSVGTSSKAESGQTETVREGDSVAVPSPKQRKHRGR